MFVEQIMLDVFKRYFLSLQDSKTCASRDIEIICSLIRFTMKNKLFQSYMFIYFLINSVFIYKLYNYATNEAKISVY